MSSCKYDFRQSGTRQRFQPSTVAPNPPHGKSLVIDRRLYSARRRPGVLGMHSSSDSADWWNVEKATVNMGSRAELQGKFRGAGTHACQECPPNDDVGIKSARAQAASPATARGCMRNTEMGGVEETSLGRCKGTRARARSQHVSLLLCNNLAHSVQLARFCHRLIGIATIIILGLSTRGNWAGLCSPLATIRK